MAEKRFYIADRYSRRLEAAEDARLLAEQLGWECVSRWLEGKHDGEPARVCAVDDITDLNHAEVLVIRGGQGTRGGKWAELGYALGRGITVLYYDRFTDDPIFVNLPNVREYGSLHELIGLEREREMPDAPD